jgi:hypothetical protein
MRDDDDEKDLGCETGWSCRNVNLLAQVRGCCYQKRTPSAIIVEWSLFRTGSALCHHTFTATRSPRSLRKARVRGGGGKYRDYIWLT